MTTEIPEINEGTITQQDIEGIPTDLNIGNLDILTLDQKKSLLRLLRSKRQIWANNNVTPKGTKQVKCTINTGDNPPIADKPRRVAPAYRLWLRKHIKELLEAKLIEPSQSPWASPIVIVPKKEGELRLAIDYRKLNTSTKKDAYPLPRIDDTLDAIGNSTYLTTLDLASGYYQIPMAEEDKEKTAFITHEGLFHFNRMPFGIANAPSIYQRFMDATLAGLKWQCCLVYIDDIIIFSKSFEEHVTDIGRVFDRLINTGLTLKSKKCNICCNKVHFLGHIITPDGIQVDPAKTAAIDRWPVPKDVKEARAFYGLASYYRKFIKNFASIAAPISSLFKKDDQFHWEPKQQIAFDTLKHLLVNAPILAMPNFEKPEDFSFKIETDASDIGIGAVLSQNNPETNNGNVIAYASRQLSPAEIKYHTREKEALAIIWACDIFRSYLIGAPFKVVTDHASLLWMNDADKGRIARWSLKMSEFSYKLIHKAGKQNGNADALSRTPLPDDKEYDPEANVEYVSKISTKTPKEPEDNKESFIVINDDPLSQPLETPEIYVATDIKEIAPPANKIPYVDLLASSTYIDDLRTMQQNDLEIGPIYRFIKENKLPENAKLATKLTKSAKKYYKLNENQILMHITKKENPGQIAYERTVIVAPKLIREGLLKHAHKHELSGHQGRAKTYLQIRKRFTWPHMFKDIKKFIHKCLRCALSKRQQSSWYGGGLQPIIPKGAFEQIHMDLVGPLPKTERGNVYLLVIIDHFTKWAEVLPIPNKEADTVINGIWKTIITRHGIPRRLSSDQGPEFVNNLIRRLGERLNVTFGQTTPYHPQANGVVERLNQTLIDSLRTFVYDRVGTWDEHIDSVTFAYRTSEHSATKETPFYLLYGREPTLPLDIIYSTPERITADIKTYKTHLTVNLQHAHNIVKRHLRMAAKTNKRTFDKRNKRNSKKNDIAIGSLIMFNKPKHRMTGDPEHCQKLLPLWDGPYQIIEKTSDLVYKVMDTRTNRCFSVNIRNCKSFGIDETKEPKNENNETQNPEDNNPEPLPEHEHKEYEVEQILAHRRGKKQRWEYLVKWKNYGTRHNSWIPTMAFATENILFKYWSNPNFTDKERPAAYREKFIKKHNEDVDIKERGRRICHMTIRSYVAYNHNTKSCLKANSQRTKDQIPVPKRKEQQPANEPKPAKKAKRRLAPENK